jgi:hypothetical protein
MGAPTKFCQPESVATGQVLLTPIPEKCWASTLLFRLRDLNRELTARR